MTLRRSQRLMSLKKFQNPASQAETSPSARHSSDFPTPDDRFFETDPQVSKLTTPGQKRVLASRPKSNTKHNIEEGEARDGGSDFVDNKDTEEEHTEEQDMNEEDMEKEVKRVKKKPQPETRAAKQRAVKRKKAGLNLVACLFQSQIIRATTPFNSRKLEHNDH
ncbi:hypothetical protein PVAG01_08460 [Phlyctema vagabunda]|uniref:Uncharacterized protein n=1 Tax=Phlyctema vagabunda TaxID=108571 RepID=A0ABR4PA58_9HELO